MLLPFVSCLLCLTPPESPDTNRTSTPAKATLRVLLPEQALLTFDEHATTSTGPERIFTTPPLDVGKTHSYTLTWTYAEGGRVVRRMTILSIQPGRQTLVDLRPGSRHDTSSQVIYVPTPQTIVDKMLDMAKVASQDVVYDLGCGDGRIVVTAARDYGACGVGIDIDPERVKDSLHNVKKERVEDLVEIRHGDALKVPDLSQATVVTLYMLPEFQAKLAPILKNALRPGTRIVAHDFSLPGWTAVQTVNVPGLFHGHRLFLYRVEK